MLRNTPGDDILSSGWKMESEQRVIEERIKEPNMGNARLLSKAQAAVNSLAFRRRTLFALAAGALTVCSAAGAFAGTGVSPAQPKVNPVSQPTPTATPSNWETAVWTKAAGAPLPASWGGSGNTHTMDVSNLVHGWRSPKRLTFFLMESLTEGLDAEQFNTDIGMMDKCDETGANVRLILDVGLSK